MPVPDDGTETSLLVIPSPHRENGFSDLNVVTISPSSFDPNTREILFHKQ
jgi:hypothetical protein